MDKIFDLIEKEQQRQEDEICLIASENYMSQDVLNACGTVLINKYSEGYPNKRYYGGCHIIDEIEQLAIDRACELFECKYANVQPNSGCQANQAVYMAVCKPYMCTDKVDHSQYDTILAMGVNEGGHISHSLKIGFAGTFYNVVEYGLTEDGYLNYDELKEKLYTNRPRLVIVGGSAYPREIDFKKIREIIDEYNEKVWLKPLEHVISKDHVEESETCYYAANTNDKEGFEFCPGFNLKKGDTFEKAYNNHKCIMMVDMAHIAGLIAAKEHMSPFPYADVVTSTVQKTLRSGRGGLILTNDEQLIKKINSAVFPRLQGGPLNNMIAAKAVGFNEALQPEFKEYIKRVKANIQAMCEVFNKRQVKMMTQGSDNHLILLDLKGEQFSGADLEKLLESIGIITNKNSVKGDIRSKMETSGLRIGTACITTRGADENNAKWIAHLICNCIEILRGTFDYEGSGLLRAREDGNIDETTPIKELVLTDMKRKVQDWCKDHPIYNKENRHLILGTDGYYWTEKDSKYDKKYELASKEDGTVIAIEVKED